MHAEAYRFVQQQLGTLPPRRSVLEIGSRNINGSVRPLFNGAAYIGIDIAPGPGVDVIASGSTFTPEGDIDTVVCCEVLEHAEDAEAIVRQALQLLPPDGVLLMTCAAPPRAPHSGVDGGALRPWDHYRNIEAHEMQEWVATHGGLVETLEYASDRGDLYLCARRR